MWDPHCWEQHVSHLVYHVVVHILDVAKDELILIYVPCISICVPVSTCIFDSFLDMMGSILTDTDDFVLLEIRIVLSVILNFIPICVNSFYEFINFARSRGP